MMVLILMVIITIITIIIKINVYNAQINIKMLWNAHYTVKVI